MGPLQEKRFDCQTGSTPLCELLQVRPKEVASQTVQVITERDCLALIELHGMSHAGRYKDAGQLQSPASFRQGHDDLPFIGNRPAARDQTATFKMLEQGCRCARVQQ